MKPITYMSEHPREWADAVTEADTLPKLVALCEDWKELAPDALRVASSMKQSEFNEFRSGLKMERRGKFAGEVFAEKYSDITMPAIIFKVSMFALDYKVPWGLAYIRLKETDRLPTVGQDTGEP